MTPMTTMTIMTTMTTMTTMTIMTIMTIMIHDPLTGRHHHDEGEHRHPGDLRLAQLRK